MNMLTVYKFPILNEEQEKLLLQSLKENFKFKEVEDDPELLICTESYVRKAYKVHVVWNSEGHWEMEVLSEDPINAFHPAFHKLHYMMPPLADWVGFEYDEKRDLKKGGTK